ncbi:MAG TPA: hypothetical protein VHL11_15520 [Phototrophicaceae bacterium]|jgi:hypothetical protein|nr:hypothetical protein [Phototrophicaceae bacterium]
MKSKWLLLELALSLIVLTMSSFAAVIDAQSPSIIVTTVAWSHSGNLIAVGYGSSEEDVCYQADLYPIQVFDSSMNLVHELVASCNVSGLAFSPNDTKLYSVTRWGERAGWDMVTGTRTATTLEMVSC